MQSLNLVCLSEQRRVVLFFSDIVEKVKTPVAKNEKEKMITF